MTEQTETKPLILIVDDEATNLQLASNIILEAGYEVAFAKSGARALEMVAQDLPDLILCDVMMPGMDGYETCERLKKDRTTRDVPVVFLTAKSETEDIMRGFDAGGVDYVTKPFQPGELLARVDAHVKLKCALKQLARNVEELKHKNDEISRQKAALNERNAMLKELSESKSELLSIASHDLKNPISSIKGLSGLLLMNVEGGEISGDAETLADIREMAATIEQSAKHMLVIIGDMLNTEAIESGKMDLRKEPYDLGHLAREVCAFNKPNADAKEIDLQFTSHGAAQGTIDVSRMREVFDNLISNAIKFSHKGSEIQVDTADTGEGDQPLRVSVTDNGPGFTEEDRQKMFGKFQKLSARPTGGEHSSGLGLSIVKKLVDMHGGAIEVESEPGNGATFILRFPR